MKPLIGITPSIGPVDNRGDVFRMEVSYVQAVERAGGIPILLPYHQHGVDELVAVLDGIIFSGGGDIRPDRYGDDYVHDTTYGINDARDDFEFALLEAALRRDIPTLAICRGIQVLNVGLGGTLYQDVADEYSGDVSHRQPWEVGSWEHPIHAVALEPESVAAEIVGDTTVQTNSAHHQSLKRLGDGLRAIGRSADGTIEAVDLPGQRFVLGVQWHPEKMFDCHDEQLRLFARLVEEARAFQTEKALGAPTAD